MFIEYIKDSCEFNCKVFNLLLMVLEWEGNVDMEINVLNLVDLFLIFIGW